MSTPNPGSPEARDAGCGCPRYDNAHGAGYMGGAKDEKGETVFVVNANCPLHGEGKTPWRQPAGYEPTSDEIGARR